MKKAFTLGILLAALSLSMVSGSPATVQTDQHPALAALNNDSEFMIQTKFIGTVAEPVLVYQDAAPADAATAIPQEAVFTPPGARASDSVMVNFYRDTAKGKSYGIERTANTAYGSQSGYVIGA